MAVSSEVVDIESAIDRILEASEPVAVKQRALTAILISLGSAQYNLQEEK